MRYTQLTGILVLVFVLSFSVVRATTTLFPSGGGTGWGFPGGLQAHTVILGNGIGPLATTSPSTPGFVLTSNGTGADPTFQASTGGVTTLAGTYPIRVSGSIGPITVSTALGTTSSNTWAGSQTFTNSPIFSTLGGGVVNSTVSGTVYNTATSSVSVSTGLTNSGTLGALIGGASSVISFAPIAANSIWANGTGGLAVPTIIATSSLGLAPIITGTQGQSVYMFGLNTPIGTSTIFTTTAGDVGVGTTVPIAALGVQGRTGAAFDVSNANIYNAFNVNSQGDIGVGTSLTPDATHHLSFEIMRNTNTDAAQTVRNRNAGSSARAVWHGFAGPSDDVDASISIAAPAAGGYANWRAGGTTGGFNLIQSSNDVMTFYTNNAERARFSAGGLFGVGTAAPTYALDVTGLGHFTGLADAANFVATSTSATSTFAGGLAVGTNQLLVQHSTGNVGIGITNPQNSLEVNGAIVSLNATPRIDVSVNPTNLLRFTASTVTGGTIQSFIGGSFAQTLINPSGGNVGIGTTSPFANLSVLGGTNGTTLYVKSATTSEPAAIQLNDYGFSIGSQASNNPDDFFHIENDQNQNTSVLIKNLTNGANSQTVIHMYSDAANWRLATYSTAAGALINEVSQSNASWNFIEAAAVPITWYTNNTQRMELDGSGNLGVGSTTPGSLFSVGGSGTGTNFYDNATTTKSGIGGYNITDGCYAFRGVCPSGSSSITGTQGQVAYLTGTNTAAGTSTLFITPAGNVGVGTITPTDLNANARLTVAGISSQDIIASTTDNTTLSDAILQAYAPGSRVFLGAHGTNQVSTQYGVTVGGWGEIAAINSTSGTSNGLLIGTRTTATPIVFGTNSTERMRIASGGQIGIGTTDPTAAFDHSSSVVPPLQIAQASAAVGLSVTRFNSGSGGRLILADTRGATVGTYSALSSGDIAGTLIFGGTSSGTTDASSTAASIIGAVDAAPVGGTLPGRLVFSTTATNGQAPAERMRIDSSGNVGIATTTPLSLLTLAANDSVSVGLTFSQKSTATRKNWFVGIQNHENTFEVTPSTVAGGSTFTNAALSISGTTGQVLFASSTATTVFADAQQAVLSVKGTTGNGEYSSLGFQSSAGSPGAKIAYEQTATGGYMFMGTTNTFGSGITNTALTIDPNANIGVSSTSPFARLSIQALNGFVNTTLFAIGSSTASATTTLFSIDNTGHLVTGSPKGSLTSCGTTNSLNGNDESGTIMLTGTLVTACTLTFANPTPANQNLTCTSADASTAIFSSVTATSSTAVTFGLSGTVSAATIFYRCDRNLNN